MVLSKRQMNNSFLYKGTLSYAIYGALFLDNILILEKFGKTMEDLIERGTSG